MISRISKRIMALLITASLTAGMLPATALAAEDGVTESETSVSNSDSADQSTSMEESNQIVEMQDIDEETYKELGLGDIKKYDVNDTTTAPFSVNPDADTELFSGREIYTYADGHGRKAVYTIRDGFDRMGDINPREDEGNRRGALDYYRIDHWGDACEKFDSECRV